MCLFRTFSGNEVTNGTTRETGRPANDSGEEGEYHEYPN
jgi:hypothetical protein